MKKLLLILPITLLLCAMVMATTGVVIDKPAAGSVVNLNSTGQSNLGIRVLDQNEPYYNITTNVSIYYKCLAQTSWTYAQSILNTTNNQTTWNLSYNFSRYSIDGTCDLKVDIRNKTGHLIGGTTAPASLNSDTNLDFVINKTTPTVAYASSSPATGTTIKDKTTNVIFTATEELGSPAFVYFNKARYTLTPSNASRMSLSFTIDDTIPNGIYDVYMSYQDSAGGSYHNTAKRVYTISRGGVSTAGKMIVASTASSTLTEKEQEQKNLVLLIVVIIIILIIINSSGVKRRR